MTASDRTESKVRQWALRRNGDPLQITDVVELALAIDEDANVRHDEAVAEVRETRHLLTEHCAEADVRDERICALEAWRTEQATTCERRVRELIETEHAERHRKHMDEEHRLPRREGDPADADFTGDRRVWLMWSVGSKVTNVLIAVLTAAAVMLVSYVIFGTP